MIMAAEIYCIVMTIVGYLNLKLWFFIFNKVFNKKHKFGAGDLVIVIVASMLTPIILSETGWRESPYACEAYYDKN